MSTYRVRYHSRFNAARGGRAVKLRVWENEEFFQTFHPTVARPGDELDGRWWAALVVLGVDAVRAAVEDGFEPASDPSEGVHLTIDPEAVVQRAASDEPLPTLVDGLRRGHDVATFDA